MQIDRPIIIALILFVVLVLVFFLVIPEYGTFRDLQSKLAVKTAEYNAQKDYYAAVAKTYFDLQSRQEDINKIDDSLPQDPDIGQTIYYLQKTASDNSMIIKSLFLSKASGQINTQAGKGSVKDIVFSMNLLGDYQSLGKFLSALERSDRIFEVTSISFGSSSQTPAGQDQAQFRSQDTFSYNLEIRAHSY